MAHSTLVVLCLSAAMFVSGVSCLPTNDQTEKEMQKQRSGLRKLGCKPRPVVVNIVKELGPYNPLADRDFFPHVVAVKRCLKECSFCGTPEMGIPTKVCLPTGTRNYTVVLSFMDSPKHVLFRGSPERQSIVVEEHTSCDCY